MLTDVIDMLEKDVVFSDENETHVMVMTKTNWRAMEQVSKNFTLDVEVLKPESMRKMLREELERAVRLYQ